MSAALTRSGDGLNVRLAGELTVQGVSSLGEDLLREIDPETLVVLDTSAVERVDTSTLQLLFYVAQRTKEFRVEAASAAWQRAFADLGLQHALAEEA